MVDYKIYTFLKLCELMNYRKTAEALNMTQPGVTQHIKALETTYGCSFFNYNGKILSITKEGELFARYAKSFVYNENEVRDLLNANNIKKLKIGATKTIGEYVIEDSLKRLVANDSISVELIISNTSDLLKKLNDFSLDVALIEGNFNKSKYSYRTFRNEEMVIICSKDHPLSHKEVGLEELFNEPLLVREEGSGTRAVFENYLRDHNYSLENFKKRTVLSSFKLIESLVKDSNAISFTYKVIAEENPQLSYCTLKNDKIEHEFNYVGLLNVNLDNILKIIENN